MCYKGSRPRIAPDALAPVVEHAMLHRFLRGHLADDALVRQAEGHLGEHSSSGAHFLADIAEIDARKLYLAAAYPSMLDYCVGHLKLSRDAAGRRIQAARTAQRFPLIYEAIEDRRLSLTSVNLLAAHLTEQNAEELLALAVHKDKEHLQQLLAERRAEPEAPRLDFDAPVAESHALAHVNLSIVSQHTSSGDEDGDAMEGESARPDFDSEGRPTAGLPSELQPLPRQPERESRLLLRMMVTRTACERLRHAQDLLSHEIPTRDTGKVFEKAIEVLVQKLEKRKFGGSERAREAKTPRHSQGRYVPANVRKVVWERDGGQCTFVSESGHRCEARRKIEFDHILEVARGGASTIENVRLRCRAHNQYTAERTFGVTFMEQKRAEARRAAGT